VGIEASKAMSIEVSVEGGIDVDEHGEHGEHSMSECKRVSHLNHPVSDIEDCRLRVVGLKGAGVCGRGEGGREGVG
jgi:hypothetical protein